VMNIILPQQTNFSSTHESFNYKISGTQAFPVGKRDLPQKVITNLVPTVWSFLKSNVTHVSTETQDELTINWGEVVSTFFTYEVQLKYILLLYRPSNMQEIEVFLDTNRYLVPFLFKMYLGIDKYFSFSEIILRVKSDDGSDNKLLAVYIVANSSLDDAYEQLRRFDQSWWLSAPDTVRSTMFINLEFE
jgi:hypothetical protein